MDAAACGRRTFVDEGFRVKILFTILLLWCLVGCVISPRRGPGSTSGGGGTGVGSIYVSNTSANSILRFGNASTASGNVVPNATISGSSTQLTSPQYLTVDVANDRLYVANLGASSVLVFEAASTKNGNVAPSRSISGSNTGLASPVDVQLDSSRNLLYVADGAQVLVFGSASTVTGNVAPVRTISVGFSIAAMLVDSPGDRLFLANGTSNAVDVYDSASTLNNTVSPNRILSGSQTQLSTPSGLQIDNTGRLVVSDFGSAAITIYANAATVNGNVSPSATISGSNTKLSNPSQIAIESGNRLFIADGTAASILVYTNLSSASGNLAPNNVVNGANTALARSGGGTGPATAKGVALDPTR
jgi:6-phosphogluconolactonase (cycloisomerase 2 family)